MAPDGLTVTVLGSAGSFPQPGNPSSGYLVRTPTATIWIDCGAGTFGALQAEVDLADVVDAREDQAGPSAAVTVNTVPG